MRTMYDAVTAGQLPPDGDLYAGYIDGAEPSFAAIVRRFPFKLVVPCATSPATTGGIVGDCEPGNGTPPQWVTWVRMRRRKGIDPTIYCNASQQPQVVDAFRLSGCPLPHFWLADWTGEQPIDLDGNVAIQWRSTPGYDVSAVASYWPGVDLFQHAEGDTMGIAATEGDAQKDVYQETPKTADQIKHWWQPTSGATAGKWFGPEALPK